MDLAGAVEITIDFSNTERPKRYIVNIEPEGGNTAGSWGGSGKLDETNIRKFENIPAGKYFVFGRPHPGSTKQESARMTISIQGGETTKLTLKPR